MATATAARPNAATVEAWEYLIAPVRRDDGFDGDLFDEQMTEIFDATPAGRGEYRRVVFRFEQFIRTNHAHRFSSDVNLRELAEAFADFYFDLTLTAV